MKHIKKVLNKHFNSNASKRKIARDVNVSRESVTNYITRAEVAGLEWIDIEKMSEYQLEQKLFPPTFGIHQRPTPNYELIHHELKKKGATLAALHGDLHLAQGDGSYRRLIVRLSKFDLLILDDFGICPIDAAARNGLLEVIDARTEKKSTLITSQIPVDQWHKYLGGKNPTVADAF